MPIFFDESGLLPEFSPESEQIEICECLSFENVQELHEQDRIASCGCCSSTNNYFNFPVYDVTGTPDALRYVKRIANSLLNTACNQCLRPLQAIFDPIPNYLSDKNISGAQIAHFLNLCLPESVDVSLIDFMDKIEEDMSEHALAIALDRDKCVELDCVKVFALQLLETAKLIENALKEHHVKFSPSSIDDLDQIAKELRDLLFIFGVNEQVAAIKA